MKKNRNSQRAAENSFFIQIIIVIPYRLIGFLWFFFFYLYRVRICNIVCKIIKYSGSCPCLCLVNNANRQADNIVITRCLFICLCLRTRSSFRLCSSRRIPRWCVPQVSFVARGRRAFTAVRSRYLAVALVAFMRHQPRGRAHLWSVDV